MHELVNYINQQLGRKPVPDEVFDKMFTKIEGEGGEVTKAELTKHMAHLKKFLTDGPPADEVEPTLLAKRIGRVITI